MTTDKPVNPGASATERDRTRNTPGTDMQDADAGTAASGNAPQRTPAQASMKQTSKTEAERGSSVPTDADSRG
jgi:hypothetical protein